MYTGASHNIHDRVSLPFSMTISLTQSRLTAILVDEKELPSDDLLQNLESTLQENPAFIMQGQKVSVRGTTNASGVTICIQLPQSQRAITKIPYAQKVFIAFLRKTFPHIGI